MWDVLCNLHELIYLSLSADKINCFGEEEEKKEKSEKTRNLIAIQFMGEVFDFELILCRQ